MTNRKTKIAARILILCILFVMGAGSVSAASLGTSRATGVNSAIIRDHHTAHRGAAKTVQNSPSYANQACQGFSDRDSDGICDSCGYCHNFADLDGSGICGNCGYCHNFTDPDGSGICGNCGYCHSFADLDGSGICGNCGYCHSRPYTDSNYGTRGTVRGHHHGRCRR